MTQRRTLVLLAAIVLALLAVAALVAWRQTWLRQELAAWLAPGSGPQSHGSIVLRSPPRSTPYDQWLERKTRDGMPVHEGLYVANVETVVLKPWPAMGDGVRGLYLRFSDYQILDGRILELPPMGATLQQKHVYETGIYMLSGHGHTEVYRGNANPLRVDWQQGSLLSIPMNVGYRHVSDSEKPVRLLAVTTFPLAMNYSANEDFVVANPFEFTDRFDGSDAYFRSVAPAGDKRFATNFVPDVGAAGLNEYDERGQGSTTVRWAMAGNSQIDLHVSQIPPRRYNNAHRHSSDAFALFLGGQGYSVIWPGDDVEKRIRINWQKGTLMAFPTYWYHQHFNVGTEPARYLAINTPKIVVNLGLQFIDQLEAEPAEIGAEWERELRLRQRSEPSR